MPQSGIRELHAIAPTAYPIGNRCKANRFLRQTESRLNPRLCYFCIKGVACIVVDTEVYVPKLSDFYLTQKRDTFGNYTK